MTSKPATAKQQAWNRFRQAPAAPDRVSEPAFWTQNVPREGFTAVAVKYFETHKPVIVYQPKASGYDE